MHSVDLTPHWNSSDTRACIVLASALAFMTGVALVLRSRARHERQVAVARDFGSRTVGWWIVVTAFMPAVFAGGVAVLGIFALTSLVTWFEFCRVTRTVALRALDLTWVLPLLALNAATLVGRGPFPGWGDLLGSFAVIAIATAFAGGKNWLSRYGWRALGFLICVLLLGAAPLVGLRYGSAWLVFVVVVVQVGDVLQYVFGKALGRRPLAPWLSPKKTWEGLVGGVLGGACLGAMLSTLIGVGGLAGFGCGLGLTLAGTASGLVMSAVKRHHVVKDFGAWLPGHGGLLDRVDSLWGAAVAAYCLLAW